MIILHANNYIIFGEKMGKCLFQKKKIQHFAPFPKLIREIPFFWNSIFSKSSYKKKKKIIEPYSDVLRSL